MAPKLAPENEAPGIVKDHYYRPENPAEPWDRCAVCHLAEAAHLAAAPGLGYQSFMDIDFSVEYRCPDCVQKNIDPCSHQGR